MRKNTPAGYKKEYPWLKEVDSLALANVQLNLEGTFRKFFREPGVGFPHYKSKKHSRKSYTTNMVNGNICLQDRFLKLPKMQPVKIKLHRMIPEGWKLKSVTVSREPSRKYFASLLFDCENQTAEKRQAEKFLGMDFAMHGMCVFSTGERARYPMFYRNTEKKLAREQRKLSRCQRGSRLFEKFYHVSRPEEGHYGLGLAIAQLIAAKHHTEITVISENGWNYFITDFPFLRRE